MQQESRTFASITFQNYFRLYGKLAGMTGTAVTSSEEFYKVYGLNTVVVPTNRPAVRKDHEDLIFQAEAGKYGGVTVATNMAGRGVDIKLGGNPGSDEEYEEVKKTGGLFLVGTERHEARRIDNQLRGRSGRQGDPGETQFFVSLED